MNTQALTQHITGLKIIAIALVLGISVGCSHNITDAIVDQETNKIHVAFAGGGWRAHTGHTAWVMTLLRANQTACPLPEPSGNPECLESAFTNVETISANSGGSWFSTMLMYDMSFINQITGSDALINWGSPNMRNPYQGWLGKQQNYFGGFSSKCGSKHGADYLECVLENYFSPSPTLPTPNWNQFVQDLVYKGYDWKAYGNLNSKTRQDWAKEKSLLMAGTLLTNAVVLNDQDDEIYYQVCRNPHAVYTDGDDGSWCLSQVGGTRITTPDVLPVTFSSLPESNTAGLKAPAFIGTTPGSFNLGYSGAYATTGTVKNNTLQSGGNKTDNVPVIRGAAASSAAAGYGASYTVSDPNLPAKCDFTQWDCVFHLRNLALGFDVPKNSNQVGYVPDSRLDGLSIDDLNSDRVMRIADGGAIDNSGIAQLISFLQLNGQDAGFEIVAFDDVQTNDASNKAKYPSSDISYLFEGAPGNKVCVQGVCVQVPPLAIVKLDMAVPNPIVKHTWNVIGSNGEATSNYLYYYTYAVETVPNSTFDVKGGSKGVIHVFASQFGCADTAPENNNDFPCYNDMLGSFLTTLRTKPTGGTSSENGYALLKSAFGL